MTVTHGALGIEFPDRADGDTRFFSTPEDAIANGKLWRGGGLVNLLSDESTHTSRTLSVRMARRLEPDADALTGYRGQRIRFTFWRSNDGASWKRIPRSVTGLVRTLTATAEQIVFTVGPDDLLSELPEPRFWSPAAQKERFPNDKFFDFAEKYKRRTVRYAWPTRIEKIGDQAFPIDPVETKKIIKTLIPIVRSLASGGASIRPPDVFDRFDGDAIRTRPGIPWPGQPLRFFADTRGESDDRARAIYGDGAGGGIQMRQPGAVSGQFIVKRRFVETRYRQDVLVLSEEIFWYEVEVGEPLTLQYETSITEPPEPADTAILAAATNRRSPRPGLTGLYLVDYIGKKLGETTMASPGSTSTVVGVHVVPTSPENRPPAYSGRSNILRVDELAGKDFPLQPFFDPQTVDTAARYPTYNRFGWMQTGNTLRIVPYRDGRWEGLEIRGRRTGKFQWSPYFPLVVEVPPGTVPETDYPQIVVERPLSAFTPTFDSAQFPGWPRFALTAAPTVRLIDNEPQEGTSQNSLSVSPIVSMVSATAIGIRISGGDIRRIQFSRFQLAAGSAFYRMRVRRITTPVDVARIRNFAWTTAPPFRVDATAHMLVLRRNQRVAFTVGAARQRLDAAVSFDATYATATYSESGGTATISITAGGTLGMGWVWMARETNTGRLIRPLIIAVVN